MITGGGEEEEEVANSKEVREEAEVEGMVEGEEGTTIQMDTGRTIIEEEAAMVEAVVVVSTKAEGTLTRVSLFF